MYKFPSVTTSVWLYSCEKLHYAICQFSSVTQSCLTLCDPMDCRTSGFPVHHQLLEFAQSQVHKVRDTIQPSHPLLSPSSPAFSLSQHQMKVKVARHVHSLWHHGLRSMEFSREEYWSGLPFPLPGDLSNPGIKPTSPALAGGFFTAEPAGESARNLFLKGNLKSMEKRNILSSWWE